MVGEEEAVWPGGPLRIRTYLSEESPPLDLVTSARAIVLRGGAVLAVEDRDDHVHILPGGRLEPGETPEAAARREVLEETGWLLGPLRQIGFRHLHRHGPKPAEGSYPHPDAFQIVYAGEALEHDPAAMTADEWVRGSALRDPAEVAITPAERALLTAALRPRGTARASRRQGTARFR